MTNEFMPAPHAEGETYGSYGDRLEEALVKITTLKEPSVQAIEALAFIAMEAPADFDWNSLHEIPPYRRMREFLSVQSEELRGVFRSEARKLPRGREDRMNILLRIG